MKIIAGTPNMADDGVVTLSVPEGYQTLWLTLAVDDRPLIVMFDGHTNTATVTKQFRIDDDAVDGTLLNEYRFNFCSVKDITLVNESGGAEDVRYLLQLVPLGSRGIGHASF